MSHHRRRRRRNRQEGFILLVLDVNINTHVLSHSVRIGVLKSVLRRSPRKDLSQMDGVMVEGVLILKLMSYSKIVTKKGGWEYGYL